MVTAITVMEMPTETYDLNKSIFNGDRRTQIPGRKILFHIACHCQLERKVLLGILSSTPCFACPLLCPHLLSSLLLCSQLSQGCCLFLLSTLFCSLEPFFNTGHFPALRLWSRFGSPLRSRLLQYYLKPMTPPFLFWHCR